MPASVSATLSMTGLPSASRTPSTWAIVAGRARDRTQARGRRGAPVARPRSGGDLEREPALARAARSGERDEPHVRAVQQRQRRGQVLAAADQAVVERRQRRAAERAQGANPSCRPAATSWKSCSEPGCPSAGGSRAGGTRARDRRRRRSHGSPSRPRSDRRVRRRRSSRRRRRPSPCSPRPRGRARPCGSRSAGARRRPAATAPSPARVGAPSPRAPPRARGQTRGRRRRRPSRPRCPLRVAAASRTSSRSRARTGANPPRSEFRSRVEPSMSANSSVTVPLGSLVPGWPVTDMTERVYRSRTCTGGRSPCTGSATSETASRARG